MARSTRAKSRTPSWYAARLLAIVIWVFVVVSLQVAEDQQVRLGPVRPLLPGQQIWAHGVSSLLFGTNDTYEYTARNVETDFGIQAALRNAGFTLMRSFFKDSDSDLDIDLRLRTIEGSGTHCLAVIANVFNAAFARHFVQYAGDRCLLYEFGNEPHYSGIPTDTYLRQWNTIVPELRRLNPRAKFIGPADFDEGFLADFLSGVRASGVLPDAISYHWYPCFQEARSACLAKADTAGAAALRVRQLVVARLGKDVPVGVSEWNYDPNAPPPAYGNDAGFMSEFTVRALRSLAGAGVAFACQFDAASFSGYGVLDMFDVSTGSAKPQFYAMRDLIAEYRPTGPTGSGLPPEPTAPVGAQRKTGELLSRGAPVVCSANNIGAGGGQAIVDGRFGNWGFWSATLESLPAWCAIRIGTGPTRLLLTWMSDYAYDYLSPGGRMPRDYAIAVSPDSTNGADGTWQTVASVSGNEARAREHLVPFAGQAWVRMTVTAGQPASSTDDFLLDEIEVFDASQGPSDSFAFVGDDLTINAYSRFDGLQPAFADDVHAAFSQRYPAMLDEGTGAWTSFAASRNIDTWLRLNPDMKYWLIGLGSYDALGGVPPSEFAANLQTLVDRIREAGHEVILAHIPYTTKDVDGEVQALNNAVDRVTAANGLIPGPDLYGLVRAHADYLSSDGLHPSDAGALAMNAAWFQALRSRLW